MKLPFGTELSLTRFSKKGAIDRIHANSVGILGHNIITPEAFPKQETDISAQLAAKIYQQSPYVNAAIRVIAGCLASVPLKVYMKERTGSYKEEKLTGEPYRVLNWVNPYMTQSQLIESTVSWLMLNGNAYWAIEDSEDEFKGTSRWSIFPMNPQYVIIKPDPITHIKSYYYKIGSDVIEIPYNRVVHFQNFSPVDYWYGSSILSSLRADMQIERLAKKQVGNFFSHAAVISGVLEMEQDLDDDEIRKIKKEFFTQYGGSRNAYRIMVLSKGMKYQPLKANIGDSQAVNIVDQTLGIHAMVLGVPTPVLTGESQGGKLVEAEALMWKKTIMPLGTLIAQNITKQIALPLSDRLVVDFDYSNVEALRLQDLDRTRVEVAQIMSGYRTPNEIRAERNWEPYVEANAEFGDTPSPVYNINNPPISPSLSLPGSRGGRDQSGNGEAQMADTTGQRSLPQHIAYLKSFLEDTI